MDATSRSGVGRTIMAYKDKDKQREANRTASQRRRDMLKGMANQGVMDEGMTKQSMTERNVSASVIYPNGPYKATLEYPSQATPTTSHSVRLRGHLLRTDLRDERLPSVARTLSASRTCHRTCSRASSR